MGEPARSVTTSLAEFLAWEERQPERWERIAGVVRMMAGGTADHNTIAANLLVALRSRLAGRPCRVFVNDLKVASPRGESTYPDVIVVCPPPPGRATTVETPTLVAEVLSPSTEGDDQGRKRWLYYSIPSLRHYVLIDQREPTAEVATREPDGTWRSVVVEGLDGSLELPALGLSVPLAEVFADVELEPRQAAG
jgi:Uma2 family endonuclease